MPTTFMSDPKKIVASRRAAAYSMLLSLHRYSKWVGSLRTATPSTLPMIGREIRLMLALKDEHFSVIGRQLDEVAERHRLLADAVEGKAAGGLHISQDIEFLSGGASQGEAVNRLVSMVESYLRAEWTGDSNAGVTDLRIPPKAADQRSAST